MNFLAHAYLSGNQPGILVGNMISDFVKGRKKLDYPVEIQKGIMHHRMIDGFTDMHPATTKSKKLFKPAYGLYAGAFMDVVYDHFLANDKNEFPVAEQLADFSRGVYKTLNEYITILPERFRTMLPYMESHDWLYNYASLEGIRKGFAGLVHRAKYIHESESAFQVLIDNYSYLNESYNKFFKDVKIYAADQLALL